MGEAEAGDLAGEGSGFSVNHLHDGAVGDEELACLRVHGEVVPVAGAAYEPSVFDDEWAGG